MNLNESIKTIVEVIVSILGDNKPSIYLYGSVALDDFNLGWSDIDILVLTSEEIAKEQADILVDLRKTMQERFPDNPYFPLFEGNMLSIDAFLNKKTQLTIYWGTSGQRITEGCIFDSFSMSELIDSGILLYGDDVRTCMKYPTYGQLRDDVQNHIKAVRKYGDSVGWLLDIARGIYTIRTGKIIAKTKAGQWVLEANLCPNTEAIKKALKIRRAPSEYTREEKRMDNATVQSFADVLEKEIRDTERLFAESELRNMDIKYDSITEISVWRVGVGNTSYILKCFDEPDHRREIQNYKVLSYLGIPTLKIVEHSDYSLLIEDIEQSSYRIGTKADLNDPNIARLIAIWYRELHNKGRNYPQIHNLYDECDVITRNNINIIKEKTDTADLPVWIEIDSNFDLIKSIVLNLPRTLTYNDFYFTNLAVARDNSMALMFDYNLLGKGYVYSDIRNVCSMLGEDAKESFLSTYGYFNEKEIIVDNVASTLTTLHFACKREKIPSWAVGELEKVRNGELFRAVKILIGKYT